MSKKKNKELRQVQACEWLQDNYLQFDHIRHDIVTDRLQIRPFLTSSSWGGTPALEGRAGEGPRFIRFLPTGQGDNLVSTCI